MADHTPVENKLICPTKGGQIQLQKNHVHLVSDGGAVPVLQLAIKTSRKKVMNPKTTQRNILMLLLLILISTATTALYFPYLNNELIFDDHNLFHGQHSIYDFAIEPFNQSPRTFPLFTLGFVEMVWHSIKANRWLSLAIHLTNALLLYRLLYDLLRLCEPQKEVRATLITAATGALFFALHPVATYGAGYLAQRTMLLATFFSLWSIFFYLRAYRRDAYSDLFTSALFYTLAIYSKEHAIMLPAAIALTSLLQNTEPRIRLKKAGIYLFLCAIPGLYVILLLKGIVGAYEPVGEASSLSLPEIALKGSQIGQWALSALNQVNQFFHYITLWLIPDPGYMSVDMRIDFIDELKPVKVAFYLSAFSLWIFGGIALLRKRKLAGFGLLYAALLFCTEFSSFRLQEPFVLYRSYLWSPGILIVLTAILSKLNLSTKPALVLTGALIIGLTPLSRDRLESLRNDYSVWSDAATKLTSNDLPGAGRIFYNLGNELLRQGHYDKALINMEQVIALNPLIPNGYLGRSKAYQNIKQYELALADLESASKLTNNHSTLGKIEFEKFSLLTLLNRNTEAQSSLNLASNLGHPTAKILVDFINDRNKSQRQ